MSANELAKHKSQIFYQKLSNEQKKKIFISFFQEPRKKKNELTNYRQLIKIFFFLK